MKDFPMWGGEGYTPSVDECVRARTRTSGIVKETCTINNGQFCLIDVGGQRAERRKWLHIFDNVTAAIFVAALSDYDQVLYEEFKRLKKRKRKESVYGFIRKYNAKHPIYFLK
jgi:hypothetical protein